jgi:uncharacterized RDD family membrane protein YckC
MSPENRSFVVRGEDGEEYGPVDLEELRGWVRENRAGLGTEVRRDEPGASWNAWQNYPELIALLAEAHVTGPVMGPPGLVIAPMGLRVLAFGLDLVLVGIPTFIICLTMALVFLPDWYVQVVVASAQSPYNPPDLPLYAKVVVQLISDFLLALYFALFHATHGQTPAKALFHLRVVDQAGQKPGVVKAVLRAVALIFSMGVLFLPLVFAFFNPQRRALHDFIAGTYVVEA